MGFKRDIDNVSSDENEDQRHSKRRRDHRNGKKKQEDGEAPMDVTYGQRLVFMSVEDSTVPSDDDLEFEDEGDALAYLRSVRYVYSCQAAFRRACAKQSF